MLEFLLRTGSVRGQNPRFGCRAELTTGSNVVPFWVKYRGF